MLNEKDEIRSVQRMRFNRLQEGQAAPRQVAKVRAGQNCIWQERPTPSDRQSAICSDAIVPSMGTTKKKGFVVVVVAARPASRRLPFTVSCFTGFCRTRPWGIYGDALRSITITRGGAAASAVRANEVVRQLHRLKNATLKLDNEPTSTD